MALNRIMFRDRCCGLSVGLATFRTTFASTTASASTTSATSTAFAFFTTFDRPRFQRRFRGLLLARLLLRRRVRSARLFGLDRLIGTRFAALLIPRLITTGLVRLASVALIAIAALLLTGLLIRAAFFAFATIVAIATFAITVTRFAATSSTTTASATIISLATSIASFAFSGSRFRNRLRWSSFGAEHAHEAFPERRFSCSSCYGRRGSVTFWQRISGHRRRLRRRDALDQWFRTRRLGFDFSGLGGDFLNRTIDHFIARYDEVDLLRIAAQAFDFVVRCFQVDIRDQQYVYLETHFDLVDVLALFVEQESRDIDRHLGMNGARAFLHRLFLDDAQDVQRRGGGVTDMAQAMATGAGDV